MRGAGKIGAEELLAKLERGDGRVLLVDVRERDEWEEVRIPGAVHAPLSRFDEFAGSLAGERGREIVVYCRSGARSARAASWLAGMGHPGVFDMDGGLLGWSGPVAGGRGAAASGEEVSRDEGS